MELKKLMEHISIIPDYRQAWKVEYKLSDILLLTICAVISGAEGWEDIEDFGETHLDFLKQYGDFENGIPVHDTIARVGGYVGAKSRQRWLFYAYDSLRKTVVAHVFGERTMATLGRLMSLLSPFDVVIWMTDGWPLYESRLKGKLHVISKQKLDRQRRISAIRSHRPALRKYGCRSVACACAEKWSGRWHQHHWFFRGLYARRDGDEMALAQAYGSCRQTNG